MSLHPTPAPESQAFNYEHIEATPEESGSFPQLEISLSKLGRDSEPLYKLNTYKWVLLALALLEMLSVVLSLTTIIGDSLNTSKTLEFMSILLSFWDLAQLRLIYSALRHKSLKRLDQTIQVVKYFMIVVLMFSMILFYSKLFVSDWDPLENLSLAKQTMILMFATGIVGGLIFILYLFPAQKYREVLVRREDNAELYGVNASEFVKAK